jgi:5'-3' exonuclease
MLVDKLQENKDKEAQYSQIVMANAIKTLKKKSIPRRIRGLLNILDKCDMVVEGCGLTTAGSLLSCFTDEMQALREAMSKIGYSNDPRSIQEACTLYRVKKYSNVKK